MTYRFEPGRTYRMPTHFGPQPGPRQQPDGVARDWKHSPRTLTVSANFLTDAARLERHLPEGFALVGEPVVTVDFHYMIGAPTGHSSNRVIFPLSRFATSHCKRAITISSSRRM